MDGEKPAAPAGEGCLVVAVRVPVRVVVLVLVVPVRMAWDALVVCGRFLHRVLFRPVGRALLWLGRAVFVWPFVALWRYGVVPLGHALALLGRVLLVVPATWVHRHVLRPLGRGLLWLLAGVGTGLAWVYARVLTPLGYTAVWLLKGLGAVLAAAGLVVYGVLARLVRLLVVLPARWLYRWVLAPAGRAAAWCAGALAWLLGRVVGGVGLCLYRLTRVLVVLPLRALWRHLLVPAGRLLALIGTEVRDALGHAWRIAGRISLAVGRLLAALFRWILVEPVRRVYRTVLTPLGHVVRDAVLRPAAAAARHVGRTVRQVLAVARDSARQARADLRRALFGTPRQKTVADRRELAGHDTRTLGGSTTALTKD
ncbi:MAG TPA: hypothetical protein VFP69_12890 [Streptomyces sp.]|nr:hypothetical protein [Streptomyces sp.]